MCSLSQEILFLLTAVLLMAASLRKKVIIYSSHRCSPFNSISHRIDGQSGRWVTSINAQGIPKRFEEDASYKSYAGELHKTQNVDIGDQTNLGRQDVIDTSNYNSNVDKQNAELLGRPPQPKRPPRLHKL